MSFIRKKASLIKQKLKILKIEKEIINNQKRIFLFGSPYHSNMGDQAQTYCTLLWFKKNYPEYAAFDFNTAEITINNYEILRMIKKHINKNDKIFLHSGYHTTDLYPMEENMQREVIKLFPDNAIIVLPQTILFKNKEEEKKSIAIYNKHKNITFLCRDDISYETAQRIFNKCKLLKYPDIVTTLISKREFNANRSGILLCMRNDKEAFYNKEVIDKLMSELNKIDKTEITDTTIDLNAKYISKNREEVLNNIFNEYSKYKVIITDRYHGTIFSLISNTPVLVLSSTDHKLKSGVKWFPEEFKEYVRYIENIEDVKNNVEQIYQNKYDYKLPNYFNDKYYDILKAELEG